MLANGVFSRRVPRNLICAVLGLAAAGLAALLPHSVQAAGLPERPIQIIVPFAPGGASDLIARVISGPLQQELGQPVIVENRPVRMATSASAMSRRQIRTATRFWWLRASFLSICRCNGRAVSIPGKILPNRRSGRIARCASRAHRKRDQGLRGSYRRAKANPGHITYSSPGISSISQLGVELLDVRTGIKLVHVPYTGAGPAVQAGLSGTADLAGVNFSAAMPLIKAGKMRALIQTGDKRWFELPDVPTLSEVGIHDAEIGNFANSFGSSEDTGRSQRSTKPGCREGSSERTNSRFPAEDRLCRLWHGLSRASRR